MKKTSTTSAHNCVGKVHNQFTVKMMRSRRDMRRAQPGRIWPVVIGMLWVSSSQALVPSRIGTRRTSLSMATQKMKNIIEFDQVDMTEAALVRGIVDEQQSTFLTMALFDNMCDDDEYKMHVGRAVDTLRSDYPEMLKEDPGTLDNCCK